MSYRSYLLPLDIVEGVVPQKCMLPGRHFPDHLWPGAWVKCILNDEQFTICQLYPREYEKKRQRCIFLDTSVSNMSLNYTTPIKYIVRFDPLVQGVAYRLDMIFILSQNFFHIHKYYDQEKLRDIFYQYCTSLKYSLSCIIRLPILEKLGITAIIVKTIIESSTDANYYIPITKHTPINISDVRVESPFMYQLYHPISGGDTQNALFNMTNVVWTQKNVPSKYRISLNILISGASGSGKSSLVAEFIKDNEVNCFRILPSNIASEHNGEAERKLRKFFESVIKFESVMKPKLPTVIFIKDLEVFCPAKKSIYNEPCNVHIGSQLLKWIDKLEKSGLGVICIATSSRIDQINGKARQRRRFCHELVMPELNGHDRRMLMVKFFEESYIKKDLDIELTQDMRREIVRVTNNYTPADLLWLLNQISRQILMKKMNISKAVKTALQILPPKEQSIDLKVFKPTVGFEAIGGMNGLKETLSLSILSVIQHSEDFIRFGLNMPKGILFYGPPGCAKTTFARCLAYEANMAFVTASSADIYSPYVGCAEKFIINLFNTARKNAPCVIFLDEIDSLVGQRTSSASDVQIRVLSTLLVEMDGILTSEIQNFNKQIIVIGATNRPDLIDNALLRPGRFDKLLYVPAPDTESRLSILKLLSKSMPMDPELDLLTIAKQTPYYSGADICCLCNEAALFTAQRDGVENKITYTDFTNALEKYKPSLTHQQINWYGRMAMSGCFFPFKSTP